jgi:hypothetical protein
MFKQNVFIAQLLRFMYVPVKSGNLNLSPLFVSYDKQVVCFTAGLTSQQQVSSAV